MSKEHAVLAEPMTVSVEAGEVVITGPDGIRGSLTPDAALESAERLRQAADRAAARKAARRV
jgi:hypothetical protein